MGVLWKKFKLTLKIFNTVITTSMNAGGERFCNNIIMSLISSAGRRCKYLTAWLIKLDIFGNEALSTTDTSYQNLLKLLRKSNLQFS